VSSCVPVGVFNFVLMFIYFILFFSSHRAHSGSSASGEIWFPSARGPSKQGNASPGWRFHGEGFGLEGDAGSSRNPRAGVSRLGPG